MKLNSVEEKKSARASINIHVELRKNEKIAFLRCNNHVTLFYYKLLIHDGNSQLNTIHLPYKHEPNIINEIRMCFVFGPKFCIVKRIR